MTYHARRFSAVDAIISAGRVDTRADPELEKRPTAGWRPGASASTCSVQSCAMTLLSHIVSRVPAESKPCIQFVACGDHAQTSSVAAATAKAAATRLGRTLLLAASPDDPTAGTSAENTQQPLPDSFTPGLHHYCLGAQALWFTGETRSRLTSVISPFRFAAIDCCALSDDPSAAALAPLCCGTILVVRAGASSHAAIRQTSLHITRAGGSIIGSVLEDAFVPGRR